MSQHPHGKPQHHHDAHDPDDEPPGSLPVDPDEGPLSPIPPAEPDPIGPTDPMP